MSVPQNIAEILREHVTLEVESIDRMYLNVYVPSLQYESGVAGFFRKHRGQRFASSVLMQPISASFVEAIQAYAQAHAIPVITFAKGQRKDDVAAAYRAQFEGEEGIVFIGKAQEKASVIRTQKRRDPQSGQSYPWLVRSTALVNQYYFYGIDRDLGPFFLKFSSYFPYTAKFCFNGHEYAKRQLTRAGIAYEELDNGFLSCADPAQLQAFCDALSAATIEACIRKWLAQLPQPLEAADRAAGYDYQVSILQAEFALTQVLDRPLHGRLLFEQTIREHLDLGRPDQVQLIFGRRVTRRTPGRFRTRVITEGVTPSLHVDYKHSRIKQYYKEGRALRTETTLNDTRDFAIGKRLENLPALRAIGFAANRRLLDVQTLSHDCLIGEDALQHITQPVLVAGQRASALRFNDPTVQALFQVLVLFCLLPHGFRNCDLRQHLATLLGLDPDQLTQGQLTYQLRRLRLHGLIQRVAGSHRYQVTRDGLRLALFCSRLHARLLRPGLALLLPEDLPQDSKLRQRFDLLDQSIEHFISQANFAA